MNNSNNTVESKGVIVSPQRQQFLQEFSGLVPYSTKSDPTTIIRGTLSAAEDLKGEEIIFTPDKNDPRNNTLSKKLPKQFAMHMNTFESKYKELNPGYMSPRRIPLNNNIQEETKTTILHTLRNSKRIGQMTKYAAMLAFVVSITTQNANNQSAPKQSTESYLEDAKKEHREQEKYKQRSRKVDKLLKKYKSEISKVDIIKYCAVNKVSVEIAVAMLTNESHLGTTGSGAKCNNPGNVVDPKTGKYAKFSTMTEGVEACIRNIGRRIDEFERVYGHRNCTITQLMQNQGPDGKGFLSTQENYLQENSGRKGAYAENIQAAEDVSNIAQKIDIPEYPDIEILQKNTIDLI